MSTTTETVSNAPTLSLSGIGWGVAAALIWGGWPVLSRQGVTGGESGGAILTALDITMLRFFVAGLALLPVLVLWLHEQGIRRRAGQVPALAVLLMAAGAGVPYVLTAVSGLALAPAAHAGIIVPSCMLSFTAIGGVLFLGDRPGIGRLLGIGGILIGIAVTGSAGLDHAGFGTDILIGDALFVLSGFFWAVYTVSTRRWAVAPLPATAIVSVVSLMIVAPIHTLTADWDRIATLPFEPILIQALGQGVAAGILALLFYSKAVAVLGASRGALFAALVPGTASALAYPVLGEVPGRAELVGLAVVTTGMLVALRSR